MTLCPVCGSSVPASASTCPVCGSPLNAGGLSQTLPPGTRLAGGKYELDKVLGQGGFGITYTATQTLLGQRVAIKELFPSGSVRQNGTFVLPPAGTDPAGWARVKQDFTAEGRTVARFNHPDIVRVMDLFDENGTAYLVMELLQGRSLGSEIEQRGALPPSEVITVAQRVLSALKVVHDAGMLHRDIKPDNIYLDKGGRIVLIDFGSAREYAAGQDSSHTRLVTPGYAPLEQYTSSARFGPYTDLYAFGATLYHALTGQPPIAATDRSMGTPLAPLPANTPPALRQLIERCLEISVAKRPQSVDEALALLSQASVAAAPRPAPQPQPAPQPMPQRQPQPRPQPAPQPVPQRPQPAPQRQRAPGCGCLMPLLLLGGAAAFFMFGGLGGLLGSPSQFPETTQTQPREPVPETTPPAPSEPTPSEEGRVVVPELAPPESTTSAQTPETQTPETQTPETQPPETPSAPIVVLNPQSGSNLPPEAFTMSGTAQPGATLTVEDEGQEVATANTDADGNWAVTLPAPTPGEHTYSVSGTDGTRSEFKVNVVAPDPEANQPTGEELVVFVPEADLQAAADASAAKVSTILQGTRVQVLQTQDAWYEVLTAGGQRGWLSRTVALPSVSAEDLQNLVSAAQQGGELELRGGVYLLSEPLTLTAATRLIGAGRDQTRLVSATGDSVLTSRGADVTLQGLTVQRTGDTPGRVLLAEGGKVTLRDVRLTGGVASDSGETGSGLWLAQGASADVQGSELVGNAFGAYLSDSATIQASETGFSDNSLGGLVFVGETGGSVTESAFDRNGVNGITVQGEARPTVSGSAVRDSGERGIYVSGEAAPTLTGNTIEQSGKGGIVYDENAGGEASENVLNRNLVGIAMNDEAAPALSRNTVSESRDAGLTYSGEAGGSATSNTITGSAKPGISLWDSASPTLEANTVRGGQQSGVVYANAAGGLLRGNTISGNAGNGVVVSGSALPDLIDNVLTQNTKTAIVFKETAAGSVRGGSCEGNGKDSIDLQLTDPLGGPNLSAAGCTVSAQTTW